MQTNFPTHLSGLSRGLDKWHSIAPCQLLCLSCLHCTGAQVTLIPHQHHGNAVAVLHSVDLLSEQDTCNRDFKKLSPLYIVCVACPHNV